MKTLTQPTLLKKPFADTGDRNELPVEYTSSMAQKATLDKGFPPITGEPQASGGLPPDRKDMNALGYATTVYDTFYQAGGIFTFNKEIAVAIGGYPINARLWYKNGNESYILRSTKEDNLDDFTDNKTYNGSTWVSKTGIIGTSWVKDTVTASQFQVVNSKPTTTVAGTFYFVKG